MRIKTLLPKSEARKMAVERKSEINTYEIFRWTDKIIDRLVQTDDFEYARNILCYIAGRPGEVDTGKLIDLMVGRGKSVFIPRLNKNSGRFQRFHFMGWQNLVKNNEGYLEPKLAIEEDMSDIDLVIAPALAVSRKGHRVGYGGGYYDDLLKNTRAPKYVLAYEFQVFDRIESTRTDIRVDRVITERRVIETRKKGLIA